MIFSADYVTGLEYKAIPTAEQYSGTVPIDPDDPDYKPDCDHCPDKDNCPYEDCGHCVQPDIPDQTSIINRTVEWIRSLIDEEDCPDDCEDFCNEEICEEGN